MSDQQPAAATLPNYTKMTGPELAAALGKDPDKWATAFAQQATIITGGHITHGYIRDWIKNAMEVSGVDSEELEELTEWDTELTKRESVLAANTKLVDEAEADLTVREGNLAAGLKTLASAQAEFEARVKAFDDAQGAANSAKAPPPGNKVKAGDHGPGDPDAD